MFGISAFAAGPFSSEASSTFNAIVSEASNALASFIGANNLDVSVVEAASGSMYTVGVVPIETVVIEAVSIAESTGSTIFVGGVILENAAATATFSGANNLFTSFADAATAADSMFGRLTKPTAVSEGANVSVDFVYATFNPLGVVLEQASMAVSTDTIAEFNVVVNEAATAAENALVSQTYYRNITEGATISSANAGDLLWELINTYEPADWVNIKTLN